MKINQGQGTKIELGRIISDSVRPIYVKKIYAVLYISPTKTVLGAVKF